MALTDQQKQDIEEIMVREILRRQALGQTPLFDFFGLSPAQQKGFVRGLIQDDKAVVDTQVAALPAAQAAEATRLNDASAALGLLDTEVGAL